MFRRSAPARRRLAVVCLLAASFGLTGQAAWAQTPPEPAVTAEGAVLYDPIDDLVLVDKEASVPRPMASTTKIMTALLAIEAGTVDDVVVVSENAARTGQAPGVATLGLLPGQQIPMRDLLAGLVLRSGNDAAVAVAEHVAGTVDAFVARMNERAAALGLDDTAFTDVSGLTSDPRHTASPLDLALLGREAMRDERFADWAGSTALAVDSFGLISNRNELLEVYPGATGVKTGYTSLAGLCLVASASRGGRDLYAVVLDSEASFVDAAVLLEHGFSQWRRPVLAAPDAQIGVYRWSDGEVALRADEEVARTVPAGAEVRSRVRQRPLLDRDAPAGTAAGRLELLVDGAVVDSTPLSTAAAAPPSDPSGGVATAAGDAVEDTLRVFARLGDATVTVDDPPA